MFSIQLNEILVQDSERKYFLVNFHSNRLQCSHKCYFIFLLVTNSFSQPPSFFKTVRIEKTLHGTLMKKIMSLFTVFTLGEEIFLF